MTLAGEITDNSAVRSEQIRLARDLDAFLSVPTSPGPHPGLVLIHEAFGLNDHIKDVAKRFANAGFATIAPDLYSRSGAPDPDDYADVSAKVLALHDADGVKDMEMAAGHLRSRPESNGRVGVLGFCSGGRNALLLAGSSDCIDAAVDCWGGFVTAASPDETTTTERPVAPIDLVPSLHCPVLVVIGENDTQPSPEMGAQLERLAQEAGRDLTLRIFAGAGHAFFADYRPNYVESAAFALWPEMLGFLRGHLADA